MNRAAWTFRTAAAALALATVTACLRPSPPVVLYTLEPLPPQVDADRPGPALEVLPVRLPEVLRRPQLLTAQGPGRFGLDDRHRWGNPLDQEVQRVLIADLSALLGGAPVVPSPYGARVGAAWRVDVQVQSWEERPGQGLVLVATWMLMRPGSERAERFQRTTLRVPLEGSGPVADLARELAEALRTSR